MAGGWSFFLGLLGLGTAGAIEGGKEVSSMVKQAKYEEEMGMHDDAETLKMRKRVREIYYSLNQNSKNAAGRYMGSYGTGNLYVLRKRWFVDHLKTLGIPYDDVVVDDLCGFTYQKIQNKRVEDARIRARRGW